MKNLLFNIIILLIFIFEFLLYSRFVGINGLKTNEIIIKGDITDGYDGLKIVHFSDIHFKKVINKKRMNEVIEEINSLKPDILIFTGDLIDKDSKISNGDINYLIKSLSEIETLYGKYAVMGDNDYYNEEAVKNIYIQSNFTLLRNDFNVIHNKNNDKIFIGGVDSVSKDDISVDTMINDYKDNDVCYKVVILHEGDYIPTIISKIPDVNLILGGHSINGSINVPLIKNLLLPKGGKLYYNPYYKVNGTDIYISNGIGVNNVNFRLFNTPSINIYRIKKK